LLWRLSSWFGPRDDNGVRNAVPEVVMEIGRKAQAANGQRSIVLCRVSPSSL
jgi:hypothetical protein